MKNSFTTYQAINLLTQVSLLSRGLKFFPTPATNETKIKQQLLRDFEQFARRMILLYIYHGQNIEPHPSHVKSTWISQVQHSVTLKSYSENVKTQLAAIKIIKPQNNLLRNEVKALKELKNNPAINLKKTIKGTTTVIICMNKADKIYEAKVQLDNRKHYERLKVPMVKTTQEKVDDMTKKWLLQTPNPPRIPILYTLTKIHKPYPVGRSIISGCDGPTEQVYSFLDTLLQPIAQKKLRIQLISSVL